MRCEDEKMFYRPPLLEEPCAQTLSGKRTMFNSYVKFQRVLELTHLYCFETGSTHACISFCTTLGIFSKQCLVWAGRSFRASVFSMQLAAQRDKNMLMSLTQPHKVRVFQIDFPKIGCDVYKLSGYTCKTLQSTHLLLHMPRRNACVCGNQTSLNIIVQ